MSTKMQLNESDGTIGVPLVGAHAGEVVTLRDPSLVEMHELRQYAVEADEKYNAMSEEERNAARYTADSPFVQTFQQIIALIGDATVQPEVNELPAWTSHAVAISTVQTFFGAPLDGEGVAVLMRSLPQ